MKFYNTNSILFQNVCQKFIIYRECFTNFEKSRISNENIFICKDLHDFNSVYPELDVISYGSSGSSPKMNEIQLVYLRFDRFFFQIGTSSD